MNLNHSNGEHTLNCTQRQPKQNTVAPGHPTNNETNIAMPVKENNQQKRKQHRIPRQKT